MIIRQEPEKHLTSDSIHARFRETMHNPAVQYIENLPSPESRRVMISALNKIAPIMEYLLRIDALSYDDGVILKNIQYEQVEWWKITYVHASTLRGHLLKQVSPITVNRHLTALRGVLKQCWKMNLMDADQYQKAKSIESVRSQTVPAGRYVNDDDIRAMVMGCFQDGNKGIRDLAIIALLITTGLRRAELASITMEHIIMAESKIRIRGKNRKERFVNLNASTIRYLQKWIQIRGSQPGALFYGFKSNGELREQALNGTSIHYIIRTRLKGLENVEKITPHDFRRKLISDLLDNGVDIVTVAEIVGHEDVNTTRRYDRRPERVRQAAIDKLILPF